MAKVTSKLQVTVPKALADRYGIRPGDEIRFEAAGEVIRVVPKTHAVGVVDVAERLRIFDDATARQQEREFARDTLAGSSGRGWTREGLYERGDADRY